MRLYGGIEAGGTKFICVIGNGSGAIRAETRFPTTNPEDTLGQAVRFFEDYQNNTGERIQAIGISSFGPIDLNPGSPTFGFITQTPKPGWSNTDVVGTIRKLGVEVYFDTDTNGAAIGEHKWGAAQGFDNFLYFTIGTGIGGGGIFNGKPLHGLVHPEMGHIPLPHDMISDPFPGSCPFHGDCFEGLASGPAIEARWKTRGETLANDHPAWALEAHYIAVAMQGFICSFSPTRIILGGGVMNQPQLFPLIRSEVKELLNGYVQSPVILEAIGTFIVPPGLGSRAGVMGALALAMCAT